MTESLSSALLLLLENFFVFLFFPVMIVMKSCRLSRLLLWIFLTGN